MEKWHAEKQLRQMAEDYAAEQDKIAKDLQQIMKRYQDIINNSQETKRKLQKEWADEEAKHKQGGARQWPIYEGQCGCYTGRAECSRPPTGSYQERCKSQDMKCTRLSIGWMLSASTSSPPPTDPEVAQRMNEVEKLQTSPSLELEGMGIDTKHDFAIVLLATKDLPHD